MAELGGAGSVPVWGVPSGSVSSFPETSPGAVVVVVVEVVVVVLLVVDETAVEDDAELAGAELD